MKLYKYVAPHLTRILANQRVRFTPPSLFNDPFEMKPYYSALAGEADIAKVLNQESMESILDEELKKAYAQVPPHIREAVPVEFLKTLANEAAPMALQNMPEILEALTSIFREPITEGLNKHIGVLSLSEKPDHPLMWAHYAENHKGFVIEF